MDMELGTSVPWVMCKKYDAKRRTSESGAAPFASSIRSRSRSQCEVRMYLSPKYLNGTLPELARVSADGVLISQVIPILKRPKLLTKPSMDGRILELEQETAEDLPEAAVTLIETLLSVEPHKRGIYLNQMRLVQLPLRNSSQTLLLMLFSMFFVLCSLTSLFISLFLVEISFSVSFSLDKRLILNMEDLSKALREYSINVKHQEYFADNQYFGLDSAPRDE
ncbi:uncharacterized protein [Henckelia pumila]|uniref:uncharacterized protein n=1 Tax=Henckelia pumila TaxID=405737 RepID=UPI003C6E04D3